MSWPWEIVERDHELQNPTSPEKILLLGDYLRLTTESRVLDIACGKAGPALILAATYGCRIHGIEKLPAFADEGRARDRRRRPRRADRDPDRRRRGGAARARGLGRRPLPRRELRLGHDGRGGARCSRRAVRPGGFVAIGEPFWRRPPSPDDGVSGVRRPAETVERFERAGLALTGLIASSRRRLGPLREPPLARDRGVAGGASRRPDCAGVPPPARGLPPRIRREPARRSSAGRSSSAGRADGSES